MTDYGQIAYEARYAAERAEPARHNRVTDWEHLHPLTREAWRDAARAVLEMADEARIATEFHRTVGRRPGDPGWEDEAAHVRRQRFTRR